jgi:sigma-E factor negative regulatory protein RseC
MLYQAGLVAEISRSRARIEFQPGAACQGCASGHGCGLGPLIALFRRPGYELWVDLGGGQQNPIEIGDPVRIGLSAAQLIKISSVAYLLPIIGMLMGAWLLTILLPQFGDVSAATGAGLGIFAGWGGLAALRIPAPVMLIN